MKPGSRVPSDGSAGSRPAPAEIPPRTGFADLVCDDSREPIEPSENLLPLPFWLITFSGVLLFWGGIYLQRYSGDYAATVYNENAMRPGLVRTNAAAPIDPYVLGRRLFADTCAKCHQPDGQGVPGQYPPLAGSEWVLAHDPTRMIRIVLDALQGPVKVKGAEFNNTMTPWRDTLTDQQIAAVITYVRTQKDWGNNASTVTPEEVAQIRAKTKNRQPGGPWTVNELLAVPVNESPP
jgi:mono/diheme cytochrome c family protein